MTELKELTAKIVEMATKAGADTADCVGADSKNTDVTVRLGKVEKLKQASSKVVGLRIFSKNRSAISYTSDLQPKSLEQFVKQAVGLARITGEDKYNALPNKELHPDKLPNLNLYDPKLEKLPVEEMISLARKCEDASLKVDKRIKNSDGGRCYCDLTTRALANSSGFAEEYRYSYIFISTEPIAESKGQKQNDYWFSNKRFYDDLDKPEEVGRIAAERVLRKLNPQKIETQEVPVVFDPNMATDFIRCIFSAVSGSSIYRKASFLIDKLGEHIASPLITIIDDPLMPKGLGSKPADDEGVKTYTKAVIDKGVLKTYLHNTYTAKKLNAKTTGNASRGISSQPGVGPTNFYLKAGTSDAKDIIKSVKKGLYLTYMFGFGANTVTGDWSRGSSGLWIEDGKLTFPVEEITTASTMQEMLKNIEMVGNDLDFRGSFAAPTIKISKMIVSSG
jgi:PmbA protein